MNKKHSKDWKTRMNRMLQALRFLAEDPSVGNAAKRLRMRKENLYRYLKEFRTVDFPTMSHIVDAVRNERLLEKGRGDLAQRIMQTRIRRAEQGYFMGTHSVGYKILDGKLIEVEEELKRVKGVLNGFKEEYKEPAQLAREFNFPLSTVHRILSNPVYKGEFVFLGKPYKGNWKPLITPKDYDEIQSMLHAPKGGSRLSRLLYKWKGGRWVARPGAKEVANKMLDKRLEEKSSAAIAKELKISRTVVDRVLKDRRITGKIIDSNGNCVDSGFEQLADIDKWEKAQKVHVPTFQELEMKRSRQRKQEIMTHVPAYRWEVRERMKLSKNIINTLISDLKRAGMLKEKADGLLTKAWENFPEKVLTTRIRSESKRIKKILELLNAEKKMTLVELRQKTGFSEPCVQKHISRLRRMGVVERQDYRGYRIRDNWVEHVAKWLSQPHISNL